MATTENKQYFCEKCKRTMNANEFYLSKNTDKYEDGRFHMCKKCLTMHVDNWNPETFLWILKEADVPWIPDEWNKLMATYGKDPSKLTCMTIIGRYLAKMKLKQFKDYGWKDTEFLQEMANAKIEETMKRQGYAASEIASVINTGTMQIQKIDEVAPPPKEELLADEPAAEPIEDYFSQQCVVPDPADDIDLTAEDCTYLRLKWGKTYKPEEWVRLEQLYNEMMESYDIQSAGHIDTLKLICKTSLKANQLIDIGDIEGFQKMSKVYDSLMKSGKFTAAQNKAENGEFVDSVGELVMLCEKEGYIERYYIDEPKDKVDETLMDMKRYTRTLISEESNLINMIESAIKQNEREDKAADENTETDIITEDDLNIADIENQIKDTDFEEFGDFLDNEAEADKKLIDEMTQGG